VPSDAGSRIAKRTDFQLKSSALLGSLIRRVARYVGVTFR